MLIHSSCATDTVKDAQLELADGVPRLYIMRLQSKGGRLTFQEMNYHAKSSQSLGSISGAVWYIAVARATFSEAVFPTSNDISVFRVPGNALINLKKGTWHAGPLFKVGKCGFFSAVLTILQENTRDFINLELSDTNINDRHSHLYSVVETI
ncbi:Ureidoglycolate hydrolase [Ostreococcus tauri]|uniref:Ureidoglycolate hydrolase n=1 Tax=Ostreococcus tauri TaxID=70448 RepID=A0A090M753_OSTTA|nr:Ureidoglycolate hydrolase [Ostreococcus tauri]CEG00927.1 Ureidoglycolate hydrolase [Ostreococcus tauri]|eukprot:XP_022840676.1 Ureidoglycolate hydrolase [Ostreococcus tauri]